MTNSRDSSGGYLTGDESERLWDREEEDAYTAEPSVNGMNSRRS